MKKLLLISLTILTLLFTACSSSDNTTEVLKQEPAQNPIAVLKTNHGDIKVELFLDKAPITAGNFKSLVESGFYDGIKFHRVIDNFMIQSGDPNSKDDSKMNLWGTGGSDKVIEDEYIEGLSNVKWTLSMANAGPNTATSQFFINTKDNTFLDWDKQPLQSKHAVFGKVIEGMEVVEKISKVQTGQRDIPVEPVIIEKAIIQ